jgi:structural maintenance of chromosome 1
VFLFVRDLEKKAARWNDKQLSALKSDKEKLSEELREAMKKLRKESELHTVNCTVKGNLKTSNSH